MIPTFSPQGDGNHEAFLALRASRTVDPYLFPARGRKLMKYSALDSTAGAVDPYLFPARGRKPVLNHDARPAYAIVS